jgi:hypothetical protein
LSAFFWPFRRNLSIAGIGQLLRIVQMKITRDGITQMDQDRPQIFCADKQRLVHRYLAVRHYTTMQVRNLYLPALLKVANNGFRQILGISDYIFNCPSDQTCAIMPGQGTLNNWGCCDFVPVPGCETVRCPMYTTCVDSTALASCNSDCVANTAVLKW